MKRHDTTAKKETGFTLIELIIVVAMISVLMGVTIPGAVYWLPKYRLTVAARDMHSTLQSAKLEAAKNNSRCTITFNQAVGGTTYDYVVFLDKDSDLIYDPNSGSDGVDNDGDGDTDEADEIERIVTLVQFSNYKTVSFDTSEGGGDGIDDTLTVNGAGLPAISFLPNGLPVDSMGNLISGSIYLVNIRQGGSASNITKRLSVAVSAAGAVSVS